jgi:hypothetical protein
MNCDNIAESSGMLEKRARRVFTRKPLPSGVISGIITTSANICAHESK